MADSGENTASFAVGSFEGSPILRLGKLFAEHDKAVRRRTLKAMGDLSDAFIAALEKSFGFCRRGASLYPAPKELSVSFNGGKDACVVLYLWLAALEALRIESERAPASEAAPSTAPYPAAAPVAEQAPVPAPVLAPATTPAQESAQGRRQSVIFFDGSDEFPAVRTFVSWAVSCLDLHMITVEGQSFRDGMGDLVAGGLRAVVMGQRRGDPWMQHADVFSPSTEGWPSFMRINPILDWSYCDVWVFLRTFSLPYCALYNDGYTSLGSVSTTLRNPALRHADGSYAAAHEMSDESLERCGRFSRQGSNDGTHSEAATERSAVNGASYDSPTVEEEAKTQVAASTAGIIVVGDEILNGKVHDCNAHYLCGMLHSRGLSIKSNITVPDDIGAIASAVQQLSEQCDFVFTSGGLGPTHDDVTVAGVAAAFKRSLVQDDKLFSMLRQKMTKEGSGSFSSSACHKMAAIPQGATVEWPDDGNPWPLLSVNNVYIFAGVPTVCRNMFERAASDGRFKGAHKFEGAALHLDAEEEEIVDVLQCTVDAFPSVTIGSYPSAQVSKEADSHPRCRLTITFEAREKDAVEDARAHLRSALPPEMVVDAYTPTEDSCGSSRTFFP